MMRRQTGTDHVRYGHTCRGRIRGRVLFTFLACFVLFSLESVYSQQEKEKDAGWVTRFGRRYLKEAELVAEVTVQHVYQMGLGTDVVKIRLDEVILTRLPLWLQQRTEHLVLAHRHQFMKDTRLLLVLKRFGKEDRLTTLHRLSHLEKHYRDKVYLIRSYVEIESLAETAKKREALARLVLGNLDHESEWVRLNSLHELEGLLEEGQWKFTSGDAAFLEAKEKGAKPETFKQALIKARRKMAEQAEEGPALIRAKEEKKESDTEETKVEKRDDPSGP